ncbi:MAG: YihA family ribosome biogenesis GTP-binding protein [Deltaproteobacteria bacterium]|nr:YihA family ribosome biogenesis GTP-binding protein [Deltaproteobacteria bacterium]
MKIKDAVFVKSAAAPRDYPHHGLPEVAFAGRSNVGKSSLINRLVHRRTLAKTSSAPGKTRLLNFYLVNSALSLVDLPGYGYAKVPEKIRRSWGPMVETYLDRRKELRLVVLLLDARHEPSRLDIQLAEWMYKRRIPFLAVATKLDKVPPSRRMAHVQRISAGLSQYHCRIIPFSAVTGEGKTAIWEQIARACEPASQQDGRSP